MFDRIPRRKDEQQTWGTSRKQPIVGSPKKSGLLTSTEFRCLLFGYLYERVRLDSHQIFHASTPEAPAHKLNSHPRNGPQHTKMIDPYRSLHSGLFLHQQEKHGNFIKLPHSCADLAMELSETWPSWPRPGGPYVVEAFQMMYSLLGVDVWAHPVVMLGIHLDDVV